jgi:peptidoglycan-N-acetylglucosamine deacetylase
MTGPWPEQCEAAVSLTFDDGMASQREIAAPMLEEHGLRGTFYLIPQGDDREWRVGLADWLPVAAAGHEIGDHSVAHLCSETASWVDRGLEHATAVDFAEDLDEAERRLDAVFGPAGEGRSFAYPCYQHHVGAGLARESTVPLVAARFVAGRGGGMALSTRPNDPRGVDLHHVWSWSVERCSGAELIGLCEWAALEGGWAVLTLHGIGEGHLPVAPVDLRLLLRHLDRHRDRLWTAPVADVAARISTRRSVAV